MSKMTLVDANGNPIQMDEPVDNTPQQEDSVVEEAVVEDAEYNPADHPLQEQIQQLSVAMAQEAAGFAKLLGIPTTKQFMYQAIGFFRGNLFEQLFYNFLKSNGIVDVMDILVEEDVENLLNSFKQSLEEAANVQSAQILQNLKGQKPS